MTIDIKRLKTDAAYWDEIAPEGATHYDPTDAGKETAWMKIENENWFSGSGYYGPFRWERYGRCFEAEDQLIPRPTKTASPEWDGEGLPPVGVECEYKTLDGEWWPVVITAVGESHVLFLSYGVEICRSHNTVNFRPLLTKEQRQREELSDLITDNIKVDYTDGNFYIDDDKAVNAILSRYNLEPKP